jgi:hypothetical protein
MTDSRLSRLFKRSGVRRMRLGSPNTLYGYFELRVDRIVGWVEDTYRSSAADMQVDVRCGGHLIASVVASAQPGEARFFFSVTVDDRVKAADLIRETVIVVARDSDGNTGRLLLDGAAQLELIRDYLGVPTIVSFDLDFSPGGNARPYLGSGWSGSGVDVTFMQDDESFINFETPSESGTYALRITIGAIIQKPDVPEQALTAFVNGVEVAQLFQTESPVQFHEFMFSSEAFTAIPHSSLRFYHPDAKRPCDLGWNGDIRRLAFSVKRISLVRLVSPPK